VPNVLLESAACGTPFVASRVGGIPEIAHVGPSRLVTPGDPAQLAGAVRDTLAQGRPATGQPARTRAEAVRELEQWLTTILESRRRAVAPRAGESSP
jgi:glycosyltransferase involved in cell wall biosynthesis